MKVKKIGALCKAQMQCLLFDELSPEGEIVRQWISNGLAMWPVSGLPQLTAANLGTLFDFSPEQVKKMRIKEDALPEDLCGLCYDLRDEEEELIESSIRILEDGVELMALTVGGTVLWLNSALLAPCWAKETKLVRREHADIKAVAVLDGLFLSGIILPALPSTGVYQELIRLGTSRERPTLQSDAPENEDADR